MVKLCAKKNDEEYVIHMDSIDDAMTTIRLLYTTRHDYDYIRIVDGCNGAVLEELTCIPAEKAWEFWSDLKETMRVDPKHVAKHMGISLDEAEDFLTSCVYHGITKRQGGGYVV